VKAWPRLEYPYKYSWIRKTRPRGNLGRAVFWTATPVPAPGIDSACLCAEQHRGVLYESTVGRKKFGSSSALFRDHCAAKIFDLWPTLAREARHGHPKQNHHRSTRLSRDLNATFCRSLSVTSSPLLSKTNSVLWLHSPIIRSRQATRVAVSSTGACPTIDEAMFYWKIHSHLHTVTRLPAK